ncbi:hypothetical protein [Aureibacillus halotolerans]|uniref:Uncharacterized protein n=1 Tax=Aureibacillus halotolerans TaxID=1508390 RepID=A0A4R6TVF0_9BACI|nr:hypothetical protein [Aureibacillus halotolerans]TDQ36223.1 hypothetical protein EV213_11912 [Aureibacillus halotolerans]
MGFHFVNSASGGVSASIDLGLYVIESLAGPDVTRVIQEKMDYPYYRVGQIGDMYGV